LASNLKVIIIVGIILAVTLVAVPIQLLMTLISKPLSRKIPMLWHKMVLKLVGVRVHVHGMPTKQRPLMFIANHISWSDILILGSVCELCFVAKDDMKSWPGINYLAMLQRTVFINRERRSDASNQVNMISQRLLQGDPMVLFAEGTTGDGNKLLPFISALFGAPQAALGDANVKEIFIQPIAIAYNTLYGMPLGRYHQAQASWPGDLALGPHLLNFLKKGAYDVDVAFGKNHTFNSETKRKIIAREVFEETHSMFSKLRRLYHR